VEGGCHRRVHGVAGGRTEAVERGGRVQSGRRSHRHTDLT